MAYRKKSIPEDVQKAQKRLDGLNSIEEDLDLGNGVSVATLKAAIKKVTDGISSFNQSLSQVDQKDNEVKFDIKSMNDLSSRALKGVEFKYGKNSDEYEMAGGTRPSDRKKSSKKNSDVQSKG